MTTRERDGTGGAFHKTETFSIVNADISLLLASPGVPVSLSGAPVTLADVAAVAGVSVPTVSKVVNSKGDVGSCHPSPGASGRW